MKRKFRSKKDSNSPADHSSRNRKSRERYKMRKFKKLLKIIGTNSVLNLSSIALTPSQCAVLSLGSGFIPTPMNFQKEEEMLLLEGLRVIDRLGNVDLILKRENDKELNKNSDTLEMTRTRKIKLTIQRSSK